MRCKSCGGRTATDYHSWCGRCWRKLVKSPPETSPGSPEDHVISELRRQIAELNQSIEVLIDKLKAMKQLGRGDVKPFRHTP